MSFFAGAVRRRRQRGPATSVPAAVAELLESKQLLSATNELVNLTLGVQATVRATPYQTGTVEIQHVDQVGDEIWVLARVREATESIDVSTDVEVKDEVTVTAPDVAVRVFQVGGRFLTEGAVRVESISAYQQRLAEQDSTVLWSRDGEDLFQWRADAEHRIIVEADKRYGNVYGTEIPDLRWDFTGEPIWTESVGSTAEGDLSVAALNSSRTNVQVNGVDEADIVETDGHLLYVIAGSEIVVVQPATADNKASVLSRTTMSEEPIAMFLNGNHLSVISRRFQEWDIFSSGSSSAALIPAVARYTYQTVMTVLDVSQPAAPELIQETILDGNYVGARAIGDQVYVTVNNSGALPRLPSLARVPYRNSDAVEEKILTDKWIPGGLSWHVRYQTREEFLSTIADQVYGTEFSPALQPPAAWRRPVEDEEGLQRLGWLELPQTDLSADASSLLNVVQFDTSSLVSGPIDNIGIAASTYEPPMIYASTDSLYVAASGHSNITFDGSANRGKSLYIHKIGLTADGLVPEGVGQVFGTLESQFSIDEYNGFLRVATTSRMNGETTNQLFVLQDQGDTLEVVGRIENIAPTESIYAVRFDGDRGWLVTFRLTDPVFSLDLSDPYAPQITGELKINGYSDYLQQIDDDHLVAIGRNATAAGQIQELQVSLFDISDMSQPVLVDQHSLTPPESWSWSVAQSNHLAFHFVADTGLLAIPVSEDYGLNDSELVLLKIDPVHGISDAGSLQSDSLSSSYYGDGIQRSVLIDDFLYAVSSTSVLVSNITAPDVLYQELALNRISPPSVPTTALPPRLPDHLASSLRWTELQDEAGQVLGMGIRLGHQNQAGISADIAEFEFRILDADGNVVLQWLSTKPDVILSEEQRALLGEGTWTVEVRVRSGALENSGFGPWSTAQSITIGNDQLSIHNKHLLPFNQRRLHWNRLADELLQSGSGVIEEARMVSGYDLWIGDAETNQRVLYERGIEAAFRDLDLPAGEYSVWLRAAYEDGTTGRWSPRDTFRILGERVQLLSEMTATATGQPEIEWKDIADAAWFEVEITASDETTTLYSAGNIRQPRHQIAETLQPGTYTLRVRAVLASNEDGEWSEPLTFTVVGRPKIQRDGRRLSWDNTGLVATEVWINRAGSSERLFHADDFTGTEIADLVEDFQLAADGAYDVWIRGHLADGSMTNWSPKLALNPAMAQNVNVHQTDSAEAGTPVTLSWESAEGVDSYEVYLRRAGRLLLRQADIVDTSFTLPQSISAGDYEYWVRGRSAGGSWTEWGKRQLLTVQQTLGLTVSETGLLSWNPVANADRYELWINEIDGFGQLVQARTVHLTDLTETSYDLSSLGGRRLNVWVRSFQETGSNEHPSSWLFRRLTVPDSGRTGSASNSVETILNDVGRILQDVLNQI
ncbi:MAG: beta-propeller domain-containing protein [Planctomycetaceae bacterium]|nr:beta-propeller domain-containing protein [Planctomycetaceae bacterium]